MLVQISLTMFSAEETEMWNGLQVYDMLKRNFDRVYTGDAGFGGDFQVVITNIIIFHCHFHYCHDDNVMMTMSLASLLLNASVMQNLYSQKNIILRLTMRASQRLFLEEGNRAPWGLYMHAAWFFGQPWHFEGYKMFIQVTKIFLKVKSCFFRRSRPTTTSGLSLWRPAWTTWGTLSPTSNSLLPVSHHWHWHLHHHCHVHHNNHCHHDVHDHLKARQAGLLPAAR